MINTSFMSIADEQITFTGYFGDQPLVQNKKYYCASQGDSVSIAACRFYISDVALYVNNMAVSGNGPHLIDLFDSTARRVEMAPYGVDKITELRFNLGIDSITNVAGAGAGDLDPTKGMYWAWQSGYINMKLEGSSKLCAKSRGEFQYHLGGYAAPYNALKRVALKVEHYNGQYHVRVDVQKFLEQADLKGLSTVMSPSAKAVELAGHAVKMFSLEE